MSCRWKLPPLARGSSHSKFPTLHQNFLVRLTEDLCLSEHGRSRKINRVSPVVPQMAFPFHLSLSSSFFTLSLTPKLWACSSSAYFISRAAHHSGTPPSSQQQSTHTRIKVTMAWVSSHWLELERCNVGRRLGANVKHSWPGWITCFLLRTCQRNPNWKQESASQCSLRTSYPCDPEITHRKQASKDL